MREAHREQVPEGCHAGHLAHPTHTPRRTIRRRWTHRARGGTLTAGVLAGALVSLAGSASAASYEDPVDLGTVDPYSVLAGTEVTNTGATVLSGELGVSPGSSISGFPPGPAGGATHLGDAASASAQAALTAAYLDAQGRTPTGTSLGVAVAGGTYLAGVYSAASSLDVSGAVTLDAEGDPNAVFVFQVGGSMTTASSTSIVLTGNAQVCNVFWQIGASAVLGTGTTFAGTLLALTSISVTTGTTVAGRALARNGAVTLDDNVFTSPACVTTATTTAVTSTPATAGGSTTVTATVAAPGASTPTGTVTFTANGVPVGTAAVGPGGVATITLPVTTDVSIVASYEGFGSYAPSSSAPTVLVVAPAPVVAAPVVVVQETPVVVVPADTGSTGVATGSTSLASSGPPESGAITAWAACAAVLVLAGLGLVRTAGGLRRRAHRTAA